LRSKLKLKTPLATARSYDSFRLSTLPLNMAVFAAARWAMIAAMDGGTLAIGK